MGHPHRSRSTTRRSSRRVDQAGAILKNDKYVNGGFGDVKTIATTAFQEGGLPIIEGKCALHRQASFYANQWPEGTKVAEDGDVFAFYFPADRPGQGQAGPGRRRVRRGVHRPPRGQAVQTYLASADYANSRAKLGDWVSANKGLDVANVASPIDKLSVEILQDPSDGVPLRRLGPDAGRGRRGLVLEGHDRLDQRQGHQGHRSTTSRAPGRSDRDD